MWALAERAAHTRAVDVMERSTRLTRPLSRFWKVFGDLHRSVYLGSSGRLGSRLAWIPMLLLSTQGRKTGLVRTIPLAFMRDTEQHDTYVIVASNGGSERPPAWWLNVQANPIATVQVGRESFLARAELAPPERREALWQELRRRIPPYRRYERIEREIPIVLLRRLRPASRQTAERDLPASRAA